MVFNQYEALDFNTNTAFNLSAGISGRKFPMHWHSYGEIILVGDGGTNIVQINQKIYDLAEGDFVLIWPTELHAVINADRSQLLVIQFSNAFASSLFDFQRIMHFFTICMWSVLIPIRN